METSSSDDGGDPAGPSNLRITLFSIFLLLTFLLFGVNNRNHSAKTDLVVSKKSVQPKKPVPKTVAARPVKKKKKIYLTFDDGPNKGTQNVLDILQQENVPATFFIVGEHVFMSKEQAATWDSLLQAKNIQLCNHSFTHAHNRYQKFYEHPDEVVKDIELTKEKILPDNYIVRAPGRNCWRIDSLHFTDIRKSKAAIDSLQSAGFIVMGWDLEWHYDPKTFILKTSADEMLKQVDSIFAKNKTRLQDNLVLLAHDQVYKSSADSQQLREFVQKLKQNDEYELSTVNSYPAIKTFDSLKKKADSMH
jgi:peptidoglycan/xylan/chitin deacetylase (PgdA/CDA1 family)